MKKLGPKKRFLNVEEWEEEILLRVDPDARGKLKGLVDEFNDVFPDTLPKRRPSKRDTVYEIRTKQGPKPPVGYHTDWAQLRSTKWRSNWRTSWLRGLLGPLQVPMALQSYLSPKKRQIAHVYWLQGPQQTSCEGSIPIASQWFLTREIGWGNGFYKAKPRI